MSNYNNKFNGKFIILLWLFVFLPMLPNGLIFPIITLTMIVLALIIFKKAMVFAKETSRQNDDELSPSLVQRQYDGEELDSTPDYDFENRRFHNPAGKTRHDDVFSSYGSSDSQRQYNSESRVGSDSSIQREYNSEGNLGSGSSTQKEYDKEIRESNRDLRDYYLEKSNQNTGNANHLSSVMNSTGDLCSDADHERIKLKDLLNAGIIDRTEYTERMSELNYRG